MDVKKLLACGAVLSLAGVIWWYVAVAKYLRSMIGFAGLTSDQITLDYYFELTYCLYTFKCTTATSYSPIPFLLGVLIVVGSGIYLFAKNGKPSN